MVVYVKFEREAREYPLLRPITSEYSYCNAYILRTSLISLTRRTPTLEHRYFVFEKSRKSFENDTRKEPRSQRLDRQSGSKSWTPHLRVTIRIQSSIGRNTKMRRHLNDFGSLPHVTSVVSNLRSCVINFFAPLLVSEYEYFGTQRRIGCTELWISTMRSERNIV